MAEGGGQEMSGVELGIYAQPEANAVEMSNREIGFWSPEKSRTGSSRGGADKPEIEEKIFDVIESFFGENSVHVQQVNAHPECVPHSSRFGKNCKVLLINGMNSSRWLASTVDSLLNFLVRGTKDFRLIISFPKDEPPNNSDSDLYWDFRFIWDITGFVCIVKEYEDGFSHLESLILVEQPYQREYYLISVKWKNLCVFMDGEKILLEPLTRDKFITVWQYHGKEDDTDSRHHAKGWLSVFGLQLKSTNSDVTMCLGAADNMRVGLMPASIPEDVKIVETKADPDHRFFYGSTLRGFSMFESTQFEHHYLAIENTGAGPYLCLKEVTKDKEYDHDEILFKTVPK